MEWLHYEPAHPSDRYSLSARGPRFVPTAEHHATRYAVEHAEHNYGSALCPSCSTAVHAQQLRIRSLCCFRMQCACFDHRLPLNIINNILCCLLASSATSCKPATCGPPLSPSLLGVIECPTSYCKLSTISNSISSLAAWLGHRNPCVQSVSPLETSLVPTSLKSSPATAVVGTSMRCEVVYTQIGQIGPQYLIACIPATHVERKVKSFPRVTSREAAPTAIPEPLWAIISCRVVLLGPTCW